MSLAGELRPVRGALALALAVRAGGASRTLVLPAASAQAAARVRGLDIRSAEHLLRGGPAALQGDAAPLPLACAPCRRRRCATLLDLRDIKGQMAAKRALEIAAAGAHSLLLVGPPGTGKSMLAQRLNALLPPMDESDALSSAALQGLASQGFDAERFGQRPFRAPHHSASAVALVGGGSPPRPGEISLAHGGVLFLDELPEFPRSALEALREPLESGRITISRAAHQASYPARFQLAAAMNPCPCGYLGSFDATGKHCRCTPDAVLRYQSRLSGPLLDRIDLQVEVPAIKAAALMAPADGEASAQVAARVAAARQRQLQRQGMPNALIAAAEIDARCVLDATAAAFVRNAASRLGWSGRGLHRALRVARTIADLAGAATIGTAHAAEALQYRRSLLATP